MPTKIKNIIVTTDFSEKSGNAVEMAFHIALRHQAVLTILHVVDQFYLIDRSYKQVIGNEVTQENISLAENNLAVIQKELTERSTSLKVKTEIRHGSLIQSINDLIAEEDTDLTVVGTSGEQKIKQFILGSNSYSILSEANSSVLMVPKSFKKYQFKNMVFPVRVTHNLDDKLDFALSIAERNNSTIELLGIGDTETSDELKKEFVGLKKKLYERSADYTAEFFEAPDKATVIATFSKAAKADIIILNYQDEQSWKALFAENFLRKIINTTDVALLFYKPKTDQRKDTGQDTPYDITLPIPG